MTSVFFFFRSILYFEIQCIGFFWRRLLRPLLHGPWSFLHFRYGVSFKTVAGEPKSVTKEMTAPWTETTLPTIFSRYALIDIFNADEFGLFYQSLPSKTMHFKGQKCSGGKHSNGNAFWKRLPIFVIGKSQKPRCFKGVDIYPVDTGPS